MIMLAGLVAVYTLNYPGSRAKLLNRQLKGAILHLGLRLAPLARMCR